MNDKNEEEYPETEYYRPEINWQLVDAMPIEHISARVNTLEDLAKNITKKIPIKTVDRTKYEETARKLGDIQKEAYITAQFYWARRTEMPKITPAQVLAAYNKVYDRIELALDSLQNDYERTTNEKKTLAKKAEIMI